MLSPSTLMLLGGRVFVSSMPFSVRGIEATKAANGMYEHQMTAEQYAELMNDNAGFSLSR